MAVEVRLPKLSDEMAEGTISQWLKDVGDSVERGEAIVEVETEKVIVEVEAPQAGVIVEILVAEHMVVPVDGLLCRIGKRGEKIVPRAPALAPISTTATAQAGGSNVVSLTDRATATGADRSGAPAEPAASVAAGPSSTSGATAHSAPPAQTAVLRGGARAGVASPLARRVAEELGIDLGTVQGTGSGGKVVVADLQPFLGQGAPAPAAGAALPHTRTGGDDAVEEIPHTSLRRTIARRMSEAKGGIPHFYMTTEVDLSEALSLRERLNIVLDEGRIRVNDLMIKAAALALLRVPALNATYGEGAVRRYAAAHIGFATAIEDGLVTPVVRDCQLKSIGRIARETATLIEQARARTLTAEQLQGGTFTLSNLGMYDLVEFSAIINPPQVGILAIARPIERPVADHGQVVLRHLMRATLSADHRAVDGVTGAKFLQAFKEALEQPERLML